MLSLIVQQQTFGTKDLHIFRFSSSRNKILIVSAFCILSYLVAVFLLLVPDMRGLRQGNVGFS